LANNKDATEFMELCILCQRRKHMHGGTNNQVLDSPRHQCVPVDLRFLAPGGKLIVLAGASTPGRTSTLMHAEQDTSRSALILGQFQVWLRPAVPGGTASPHPSKWVMWVLLAGVVASLAQWASISGAASLPE
jgi:hypothetical protein